MNSALRLAAFLVAVAVCAACPPPALPGKPVQCGEGGLGCLSDEVCVEGRCERQPRCEEDEDCEGSAYQCVLPAQVCKLRAGFGVECSQQAPCGPGAFCALGKCRDLATARQCASRSDCPPGLMCDAVTSFCIDEAPCSLAQEYPETACGPDEQCDVLTATCRLECQQECDADEDCPIAGQRCDGACRCVQCITEDDCGPGLVCNTRAGRCQSENLCFSDLDCLAPLICDPATALCQAAPPPCEDDFDCQIAESCNLETGRCELPTGPCDEDRFEDADTPASARLLAVGVGETVTEDALQLCPDDDDVYAVELSAGDILIAEVTSTLPQARATVWLLNASAETSVAFAEAPPRGDGRVTYFAQQDETVFLRINALVGASPYDLVVERQGGAPCQADFFEGGGGNDTLATATAPSLLPDLQEAGARICPGDEDFYRLHASFGEALSATLTFDAAATDLDLALLDATGRVVTLSAGTDQPERVRRRFFVEGDVYLRVRGFGNHIGNYTLLVDHEPPFVCVDDAGEPNDDVGSATLVPLGASLSPSPRTLCAGDVDLLALPLEDFERAVIRASYDDTEIEARVEVLDQNGVALLAASAPATGGAALSWDAQGNQNVLVRITGVGGAIGAYTLSVDKENQLDCAPDPAEPNDTVGSASALPSPAELLTLCEPDADFFLIEGDGGKKLVAEVSFRQAEADIDVMLLGVDGAQVLAVADGTSDNEHLEHVLPVDGVYVLRVFSATSGARARYALDVTQVSP